MQAKAIRHSSAGEAYQYAEASGREPVMVVGVPYTVTLHMRAEMQAARCVECADICCCGQHLTLIPWKV